MKAQDYMKFENERADVIAGLITYCIDHDLSYNYTDKAFSISLPYQEPLPATDHVNTKKRDKFNIANWGAKGPVEGEEPDPEKPLTEGTPPGGQV